MVYYAVCESPIGLLTLHSDGKSLTGLYMKNEAVHSMKGGHAVLDAKAGPLPLVISQLREYFAGKRRDFDVPLDSEGTPFQKTVWRSLLKIPFGETLSYGGLAKRIGNPGASRAVGLANGSNPISVIVPCHRVIGANGTLTGYGGGIEVKRWLLTHEGCVFKG